MLFRAFYTTIELPDDLFSKRKDLIICKKVQRKILTSRGPVSFKRRYYLDSNSGKHLYLLDSILKIPKYTRISEELKKKIILSLDHLTLEQAGKDNLPKVLGGLGVAILSTNQGIITDKEARKLQVGGEVLAFVW